MMQRFYWLVDGVLAGCSLPGASPSGRDGAQARAGGNQDLRNDLVWLRTQDIGAVLSLTESPLAEHVLGDLELTALHIPIPDMTAPLPEQFQRSLDFIDLQRSRGTAVAVHCLMGQGRTGAILAAFLIRDGTPADLAISQLRAICPGAIGSPEQERALHRFEASRDWIV
ncbi:MAG TPA: dual specificity protein phosphatase family protein [Chloroflexota bacterium]